MLVTFLDSETSGLCQVYSRPDHDRIIELYMIQYDYNPDNQHFEFLKEFNEMFKIDKPLSAEVSKVHGIYDRDLITKKKFNYFLEDIMSFKNTEIWIGQNVFYDINMLDIELKHLELCREDLLGDSLVLDTLVLKKVMGGASAKQSNLYQHYFPNLTYKAHRAKDDVLALVQIVQEAIKQEDISILKKDLLF